MNILSLMFSNIGKAELVFCYGNAEYLVYHKIISNNCSKICHCTHDIKQGLKYAKLCEV